MEWYYYLAAFFAGVFLANAIPHFVHGISGNKFPTPFAKPSGKGLSSATTNVVWSLFNLIIGYLLFIGSKIGAGSSLSLVAFFAGVTLISIFSSIHFQAKDKE